MLGRFLVWLRGSDGDEETDRGSVWDLTPSWQYGFTGRFQGGGDARAEQEAAIEDVHRRAEALDDAENG